MVYFVAGITGNVGGATARNLLASGHKVRSIVRDAKKAEKWAEQGVELIEGNLNDESVVSKALEGVEAAFVMLPPYLSPGDDFPEARGFVASYKAALEKVKVPRVVALSSIGSEQSSGLGIITSTHLLENGLKGLDVPITFIRAGCFLENFIPSLPKVNEMGLYFSFFQPVDKPVGFVSTPTIGETAAKLLTDSSWEGKRFIELGTNLTPNEIAKAMGEALGREVHAQAVPRERWSTTLEMFGFPKGLTGKYEEMLESTNSGHIDFGREGTEALPNTVPAAEVYGQAWKHQQEQQKKE